MSTKIFKHELLPVFGKTQSVRSSKDFLQFMSADIRGEKLIVWTTNTPARFMDANGFDFVLVATGDVVPNGFDYVKTIDYVGIAFHLFMKKV